VKFGEGFVMDAWYVAALSPDLKPGRMESREYLGEPVMIGRTKAGVVYALRDVCPHRAAKLSAGKVRAEAPDGERGRRDRRMPLSRLAVPHRRGLRQDPVPDRRQPAGHLEGPGTEYPLVEAQGLVWIWMSADPRFDGQPPFPPPTIPGVVGGKPKLVDHLDYDIHIDHAVLGLIDPAHGPFVHQQWWWRTKPASTRSARPSPRPRPASP
jgi:phenylpropionate dioxygenase-like ring-hydroxylating dioxygenase large terminal subunit